MPEKSLTIKPTDHTPAAMIQLAISQGQSLEQLERLLELQIKYEANEAKKAYHAAMAAFKASPPKIDKDRHVQYTTTKGETSYKHASLYNVTEKISAGLSAQGLSASWNTGQDGDRIKVTCKITHALGHSEETSLSAAADTSGGKNMIQAIGSTVSYLERYTLLALTGLATHDMDNDAIDPQYIDKKQQTIITDMLITTESDIPKFLAFMKADSIDEIFASDYKKAYAALNSKASKIPTGAMTEDQIKQIIKKGAACDPPLTEAETKEVIAWYEKNNHYGGSTYRTGQALVFGFQTILDRFLDAREQAQGGQGEN
jgi:hypothetical protein